MQNQVISKKDLAGFVDELIKSKAAGEVIGIKTQGNKFNFGSLKSAAELRLDYDISLLPPKKYFFPQTETVLKYEAGANPRVEPVVEEKSMCIIGVHPFDIRGILLFDAVYGGNNPDPNYFLKRNNTVIIGVDCLKPNPKAFAASMGTAATDEGFDLMLTDIGDSYFVTVGTTKGENLLKKHAKAKDAKGGDLEKRDKARNDALKNYKVSLKMKPEEIPALLDANWESKVFHDKSETCFSCGSCVMVCPTCVCFDVQDDMALSLKGGERYRRWDGCMLTEFAKVASGENFREHKEQRFRHRMYRKGKYLVERYKYLGCVGCGRCATHCLAEIASPAETFNLIKEAK
ncbi:MAG: 4Fe-4S dicluster domain-containing protein [Dehalococcoidia bacterium]|nr:4Fe-4S dicluster domain-containing protein [Dehalococcoidia bacterium]MDD5494918.1 4Fe-4S dicluster domain-containing protein [Dehalococcoidia bacterium]